MKREKRGQAAMEFLMTYGWAILAAVIVVGVLWYLIGDPSSLAGNKFMMSSTEGFSANAMVLNVANGVTLEVRNGDVETITITNINVEGCNAAYVPVAPANVIAPGDLQDWTIACTPVLVSGARFNADVVFTFTTPGSGVSQQATGTITGKVP